MSFVTIDYAKKLMKLHNTPYFRVTDASNKLTINKVDTDIGISAAQDLLEETIQNCEGDYVNVKLYSEKPTYREKNTLSGTIYEFKVRVNQLAPAANYQNFKSSAPAISGPSWQDLIALHAEKNKLEMDMKMKEMEQQQKNPMNAILEKIVNNQQLMSAITGLLTSAGGKKTAAPAVSAPVPEINAPDKLKQALNEFNNVDPDYINTLSAMAKYIKKEPATLEQIKLIIANANE